jgi:hypothetical protein
MALDGFRNAVVLIARFLYVRHQIRVGGRQYSALSKD